MTIQDVAQHLQVSWDVIKDIQTTSLQRRFGKPKLKKLKQIAIDEIAIGKGHRYLTVVLDLHTGAVVYVGDGKGVEALEAFWKRLRASRAKIQAVATDMGKAYIRAVRDNLPKAVHVFDHFHVIKLFNDKLTALRRELYHQAASDTARKLLKGTRWLLLKNPENLDAERNERQRLLEALALNAPLAIAYYLKEDLRQFWSQPDKRTAQACPRGLDRPGSGLGHPHAPAVRRHARTTRVRHPGLLRLPHLDGAAGRHQQQDPSHETPGLRLPRSRFFKLKILGIHEYQYA